MVMLLVDGRSLELMLCAAVQVVLPRQLSTWMATQQVQVLAPVLVQLLVL
jgi:hypothetical protein